MKIEIYKESQTQVEVSPQMKDLVDRLSLQGQQSLYNTAREKDICLFRQMTSLEKVVYETLFPYTKKLTEYSASLVPLEVLEVSSEILNSEFLYELEIWSSATHQEHLLVGKKRGTSAWSSDLYCVARWGDALVTFEELHQQAESTLITFVETELKEYQNQISSTLQSVPDYVKRCMSQGHRPHISFSK